MGAEQPALAEGSVNRPKGCAHDGCVELGHARRGLVGLVGELVNMAGRQQDLIWLQVCTNRLGAYVLLFSPGVAYEVAGPFRTVKEASKVAFQIRKGFESDTVCHQKPVRELSEICRKIWKNTSGDNNE